jgi:CO/xanthine dehydrogenase Mo-binding subunit
MQPFLNDLPSKAGGEVSFGLVLRAPIPRGRLRGLRPPPLPEGYLLLRARDIPGKKTLSCIGFSHPVLGDPQVRYRGQPFALMCGPDREALAELAAGVRVDWDELPEGEAGSGTAGARQAATVLYRRGNAAEALADAFQIVEAEYHTARRWSHDPDLPGAFATASEKNVTVYASTQDPFGLREAVAAVLKLPSRRVRIVATRLGNPMECKFLQSALVAAHASLLSSAARKPVWLAMDAAEICHYAFPGPGFRIRTQTALDREGNMVAVRQEIELDAGAYAPAPAAALLPAARCSWGGYRVPNLEILGSAVRSSRVPAGSFRAAGRAQAFFAVELNSSRLEEIGELDPYSWKSRNMFRSDRPGGRPEGAGETVEAPPAPPRSVIDAVVGMSNFRRKHAAFASLKKRRSAALDSPFPLRGTGLAVAYQEKDDPGIHVVRPHASTVKAVLDKDKRLHLYTSFVDHGPGVHALFARRAAGVLEMEPDKVIVEDVDTQVVPDTGATTLGRALSIGLPLVEQCCQALKIKRIKGLPPIEVRRSYKAPEPSARGSEAARPSPLPEAAWGAAVVEVEVDPVSFEILVRGVWLSLACGACGELPGADRYIIGESIRALGWASLWEGELRRGEELPPRGPSAATAPPEPAVRPGEPAGCPPWGAGSLLRLTRVPPVLVRFVEDPNPGLRGFEQLPHLTVPAAYAAAVSQATGLYVDRIPITPEVLQECLET